MGGDGGRNDKTDRQMPEWTDFIGYICNDIQWFLVKKPCTQSVDNLTHARFTLTVIHSRAVQATSGVTFLFQLLCLRLQGICTITYTLFPSSSNQLDPSLVQTNWILNWYRPIGSLIGTDQLDP